MEITTVKKKKDGAAWKKEAYIPPKKLYKAALLMRKYQEGVITILDVRAVMKSAMRYLIDTNIFLFYTQYLKSLDGEVVAL